MTHDAAQDLPIQFSAKDVFQSKPNASFLGDIHPPHHTKATNRHFVGPYRIVLDDMGDQVGIHPARHRGREVVGLLSVPWQE